MTLLAETVSNIDQYTTKQNQQLEQKVLNGINSFVKYIDYTLDVVTDIAFGKPFGYLEKDEDLHDYHATFAEQAPMISVINSMPSVSRFLNQDWAKKLWAPTSKDKKGVGKLMG